MICEVPVELSKETNYVVVHPSYSAETILPNDVDPATLERTVKLDQEVAFALALAEKLLGGRGACRVHGGGFAGTIAAFVPADMLDGFKAGVEKALGEGSCHVMNIRKEGGVLVEDLR